MLFQEIMRLEPFEGAISSGGGYKRRTSGESCLCVRWQQYS